MSLFSELHQRIRELEEERDLLRDNARGSAAAYAALARSANSRERALEAERDHLIAENAGLRKALRDAPHSCECAVNRILRPSACDCPKAALARIPEAKP